MQIESRLAVTDLKPALNQLFKLAASKTTALDRSWDASKGTPVFTV